MAIKEILTFDQAVLHKKAERIDEINGEILDIIQDMKDTLYAGTGVGLAAPQIGILKKLVIINPRDGSEEIILINPKIVAQSGKVKDMEGCLSYPGYLGEVVRPKNITVIAKDINGKKVTYKPSGFLARIFCHEIDHLEGVVYTDRTKTMFREKDLIQSEEE
ncbi:peptide deformylase [Clostridium collagenovorans DSM 3089]|uniref:Peptide deformylase n=1 Tax=Clostridium collagenovorans DSM 3089 TaxID=1121306 RepID=A0A1M5TYI2_9CLOT|nr:peptide deformylase [Clostridium collagenovorans]SHH55738.1 peptide deformylase [Clostridium collagenovorans DSM 3089]